VFEFIIILFFMVSRYPSSKMVSSESDTYWDDKISGAFYKLFRVHISY